MSYSPYIPNFEAWKRHFTNPPKEHKSFYTISHAKQLGRDMDPIKLVSPTEQIVEQAKSSLKRQREQTDCKNKRPKNKTQKPKKPKTSVKRSTTKPKKKK